MSVFSQAVLNSTFALFVKNHTKTNSSYMQMYLAINPDSDSDSDSKESIYIDQILRQSLVTVQNAQVWKYCIIGILHYIELSYCIFRLLHSDILHSDRDILHMNQ